MTVITAPLRSPLRSPLRNPLVRYNDPFQTAYDLLRGEASGMVFDALNEVVLIRDASTPANNFQGTFAQALAAGVVSYGSPSTKYVRNAAGVLAAGTAMRCDHTVSGTPLGLLVESARTNLVLNSDTLVTQSVTVAAAAHTLSFYGTGTVTLSGVSTAGPLVGTGTSNRVSLTFTPTAGSLTLTVTGSVTLAQLEAGDYPTSYIRTEGATATRAADNITTLATKFPFNENEGTIVYAFDYAGAGSATGSGSRRSLSLQSTTTNRHLYLNQGGNRLQVAAQTTADGNVAVLTSAGSVAVETPVRSAYRYKADDFALSVDGAAVTTDTSGAVPTGLTTLWIGQAGSNTFHVNGHVRILTYLPRGLTDSELVARSAP